MWWEMGTMKKFINYGIVGVVFILMLSVLWTDRYYLAFSFIMIFLIIVPFFISFEKKAIKAEEVVIISVLAAIAAIGRIPFAPIPSVQPTTFVIIMTGISFGGEIGFLVGSTAALVSNIVLGQGPWTPWQMFAWGLAGLTAGILRRSSILKSRIGKSIFGGAWGFLFGWIMNLWSLFYFQAESISWKLFIASCISSFKFDLAHAITNIIFLNLFSYRWEKIFERAKKKYGIFKGS